MLKSILISTILLFSIQTLAQEECNIVVTDLVSQNEASGLYSPIIESANCEWKKYELNIYNRWGNIIFTSKAINDDWDVSKVQSGTYFYTLKATSMNKEVIEQKGNISLVK